VGRPSSPFIGQGEGAGYTREREGERKAERDRPQGRVVLHLL
jgi:hypothetical protein